MEKDNIFKTIITIAGTGITFLFGRLDVALYCLLIFMVIDFITGYLKGWYLGQASSKIGFKGLAKKGFMLLIVVIATLLDRLTNTEIFLFRTATCYFYVATEGISILENAVALDIPIPAIIKDKLIQLKKNGESEEEKNEDVEYKEY